MRPALEERMQFLRLSLVVFGLLSSLSTANAQGYQTPGSLWLSRGGWGPVSASPFMHRGWHRIVHPGGRVDSRIDPKLRQAASIAQQRANAHSQGLCWRYVKQALVASGVVRSYPKTSYAIDAGDELVRNYGFTRLSVHNPYAAPLGAVLVYGDLKRGHVEIRTKDGFASDYCSNNACFYRLIGVYTKS
jgi:hypothetical protein